MTDEKPGELTNSVRGLLASIAVVVFANAVGGSGGTLIGVVGIIGFLYFALATIWALVARAMKRRRQG